MSEMCVRKVFLGSRWQRWGWLENAGGRAFACRRRETPPRWLSHSLEEHFCLSPGAKVPGPLLPASVGPVTARSLLSPFSVPCSHLHTSRSLLTLP